MFTGRDDPRLTVSLICIVFFRTQRSNLEVKVHTGCGMEFMRQHKSEFDVIITDSSDPIGPANVLFESPYYRLLHAGRTITRSGLLLS